MLKKFIAMFLVVLLLVSCSSDRQGPSKVAYDFVSGFRELDADKISNQMASYKDKPTAEDFKNSFGQIGDMKLVKEVFSLFISEDIKVTNEKVEGNIATVDVTVKLPNPEELYQKFDENFISPIEGKEKESLESLKVILKDIQRIEATGTLQLEKVGRDWKVSSMAEVNGNFIGQIIEQYGELLPSIE